VLQISPRILHGITFRYVENVEEVLEVALLPVEAEPVEPETERSGPPPAPEGREIPVQSGDRPPPAVRARSRKPPAESG